MTSAEILKEEGKAEGFAEGFAQGLIEGAIGVVITLYKQRKLSA